MSDNANVDIEQLRKLAKCAILSLTDEEMPVFLKILQERRMLRELHSGSGERKTDRRTGK